MKKMLFGAILLFSCLAFQGSFLFASGAAESGPTFIPPAWSVIPFIGILLSIAVVPLINAHWWEHNFGKISFFWMVVAFIMMYFSLSAGQPFFESYGRDIFHIYEEYISFIILLGSLFVISGGILIKGSLSGKPISNTAIIAIGAVLASFIGTTGAAMLLIRPLLRSIRWRQKKIHVVIFFIFLVCNIGGSLTPIGDPPLFIGFLKGVPFQWTFKLTPMWAFAVIIVLAIFFLVDTLMLKKEPDIPEMTGSRKIKIEGMINFVFLLGVIVSVLFSGLVHLGHLSFTYGHLMIENLARDGAMIGLAILSLVFTSRQIREENNFNYAPILEVAYLFIGIFTTMIPALMLLNARGSELGVNSASKYFWFTGLLSSFLDNTPTYMTFLETALGMLKINVQQLLQSPVGVRYLEAISVGAVFMGAMTYIGNGPNFMVKSIAEQEKIKMPSFFGYMAWSCAILLPVFILVDLIFFM